MDFLTIKAAVKQALKTLGGAEQDASDAADNANAKATAANNAATAANSAAAAANAAAASYTQLNENEVHSRIAFNMAYTMNQAEMRALDKRTTTLESQVDALT